MFNWRMSKIIIKYLHFPHQMPQATNLLEEEVPLVLPVEFEFQHWVPLPSKHPYLCSSLQHHTKTFLPLHPQNRNIPPQNQANFQGSCKILLHLIYRWLGAKQIHIIVNYAAIWLFSNRGSQNSPGWPNLAIFTCRQYLNKTEIHQILIFLIFKPQTNLCIFFYQI